LKAREIW